MTRFTVDFPPELITAIAEQVAERIGVTKSPSPYLTVDEAAEVLRCAPKRIYDLTSQRRLDFEKDGSRTLIRREAIDNYLKENDGRA